MRRSAWIDLAGVTHKNQVVQAEICIIGAGAAGIYLARQLSHQGKSVVLLEAGSVACADASTVNFDALFEASHYPGATAGRFFGMGGSTSRWGGQLVPHTDHDLRSGTDSFDTWSHIVKNVSSNAPHVLQQLGYLKDFAFDSYPHQVLGQAAFDLHESGIESQAGLMMPFRLKNLVGLLTNYDGAVQPKVFFNAVVKSWTLAVGEKKRHALRVLWPFHATTYKLK